MHFKGNKVAIDLQLKSEFPVLGLSGSPLYLKNVKCQNNRKENDLFQLLFLSSHAQWVRSLHTLN